MNAIDKLVAQVTAHDSYKGKTIYTAGELKAALANIPDDTRLALSDIGPGWGLKKPFLSSYASRGEAFHYRTEHDPEKRIGAERLPKRVCVIERSCKGLDPK